MINNVIRVYHDELVHCGLERTIHDITANYWFPSLHKKVRDYQQLFNLVNE